MNYLAELKLTLGVQLVEATELCDVDQIDKAIDDVRKHNRGLADLLNEMADKFAYDKILSFCKNNKD